MKKLYLTGSIILVLIAVAGSIGLHLHYSSINYLPVVIDLHREVTWSDKSLEIPESSVLQSVLSEDKKEFKIKTTFSWLRYLQKYDKKEITLVFSDPSTKKIFRVKTKVHKHPPLLPKFIYTIIAGIIMLLAGFIFWKKRKEDGLYIFLMLTVSTSYVMILSYTNLDIILVSPLFFTLFLIWNASAPPSLLVFFLRYPSVKRLGSVKNSVLLFIPSVLTFVIVNYFYFKLYFNPTVYNQENLILFARSVLPFVNFLYGLGSVVAILHTLFFSDNKDRRRMIMIAYGLFIMLLILTSSAFMSSEHAAVAQVTGGETGLFMAFYSVMVLSLVASTTGYRIYLLEHIVNRSFVYLVLSVAIISGYLFLSWLLGVILTRIFDIKSLFITVMATVLVTAALIPLRDIFQKNLDRIFFKNRFLYSETLQEIGEKLSSVTDINRLLHSVLRIMGEAMEVKFTSAFLAEKPGGKFRLISRWGEVNFDKLKTYKYSDINRLQSYFKEKTAVFKSDLVELPDEIKRKYLEIYENLQAGAIVFLRFHGDLLGFFAIGEKEEDVYDGDDMDLLDSVGKQAAIGIKNALSYSTILKLNESLTFQKNRIEKLKSHLEVENIYLKNAVMNAARFGDIIGESEPMLKLKEMMNKIAATDSNVLILGESGTGKELVARTIHKLSARKERPLVTVNCAAIPDNLLESELFGHVKGAFTGAIRRKIGQFELADGSSLFLDEIGELPLSLQAKLLRAIQEGEITPLGSEKSIKVDVRLISATNADLDKKVKEGKFREDLYYRINVVPVILPPLRERGDDIKLLARYFLDYHLKRTGKKIKGFSKNALERMIKYDWPGNVRELSNVVERAVAMSEGGILDAEIFIPEPVNIEKQSKQKAQKTESDNNEQTIDMEGYAELFTEDRILPYKEAVQEFKRSYIKQILEKVDGNKTEAAKIIGLRRPYLHRLLKELNIEEEKKQ